LIVVYVKANKEGRGGRGWRKEGRPAEKRVGEIEVPDGVGDGHRLSAVRRHGERRLGSAAADLSRCSCLCVKFVRCSLDRD
jgi:hypothetical protein